MVNLKTDFMGVPLEHPLICGSSPFGRDIDSIKRMQDGGAAGLVLPSIFEEQILKEQKSIAVELEKYNESFSEATTFFPPFSDLEVGPYNYLEMIRKAKEATDMPIFASLNAFSEKGWTEYPKQIEQAGADGLEINIFFSPVETTFMDFSAEELLLRIAKDVTSKISIPVSMKMYPEIFSLPALVQKLNKECGLKGVTLFNRVMDADFNINDFKLETRISYSSPSELLPRLFWGSVVYSFCPDISIAISGGVHSYTDAIKAALTGASAIQIVSAVIQKGPEIFKNIRAGMEKYMEEKEFNSYLEMRGALQYNNCPNPVAYHRLNYLRLMMTFDY